MCFGNMGPTSGTGVCFTRNPNNGEKKLFGEFLFNAQGEDGMMYLFCVDDLHYYDDQFVQLICGSCGGYSYSRAN